MTVIRVAFQCDILRAATFMWCPGTNHVAFQGMFPFDPEGAYMHHPLSYRYFGATGYYEPLEPGQEADIVTFLSNVHTWFNQKFGQQLVALKSTTDVFGGNLLDHTVVPYVTEKANQSGQRSPTPALLLGGRALGLSSGQHSAEERLTNDMWMTVAQALSGREDVMALFEEDDFFKRGVAPIPGLWNTP